MKFLIGKEKDFFDFIDSIKSDDKVGIITHTDLDGLASAFFLEKILESRGIKVHKIKFIEYGDFEKSVFEFKKKRMNKLFVTDLYVERDFCETFEKCFLDFDTFFIDHHPIVVGLNYPKNVLKTATFSCTTLALYNLSKRYFDVKKFDWLLEAAIVADRSYFSEENLDLLKKKYPRVTRDNIMDSAPGEMMRDLEAALIYCKQNLREAYNLIKKEDFEEMKEARKEVDSEFRKWNKKFNEEAEYFGDKKMYYFYGKPRFGITSALTTTLSLKHPDKIIVFVSDSSSKSNRCKVSARNHSQEFNMDALLKKGIAGFKNANAGGHIPAAGGSFRKEDLKKFKENLLS